MRRASRDTNAKELFLLRAGTMLAVSLLTFSSLSSSPLSLSLAFIAPLLALKSMSYAVIYDLIAYWFLCFLYQTPLAVILLPSIIIIILQSLNTWISGLGFISIMLSALNNRFTFFAPSILLITSSFMPAKEALIFSIFTSISSLCLLVWSGSYQSLLMVIPPFMNFSIPTGMQFNGSIVDTILQSYPFISSLLRIFLADLVVPLQFSLYVSSSYISSMIHEKMKHRLGAFLSLLASTFLPLVLIIANHGFLLAKYGLSIPYHNYLLLLIVTLALCYTLTQISLLSERLAYASNSSNYGYYQSSPLNKTLSLDDVGDMEWLKEELYESIVLPLIESKLMRYYNVKPVKGILLFGPPGCGKTLIMRALASSIRANFLYIRFSDILSKWYGESERRIAEIFEKARSMRPCIIFLDEIDALGRSRDSYSSDDVAPRILSVILSEMDGLDPSEGVIVVAATNTPHLLDPALLRPGRFDKLIYVPPPDLKARAEILRVHLRNMPLSEDVSIEKLASLTDGFSGADLAMLCQEVARRVALEAAKTKHYRRITMEDFLKVLSRMKPSITSELLTKYVEFQRFYERRFLI